jgi:hypothetical protein
MAAAWGGRRRWKNFPRGFKSPPHAPGDNIGVRDCPYGICCPWLRAGWDLEALGKFFHVVVAFNSWVVLPDWDHKEKVLGALPPNMLQLLGCPARLGS